MTWQQITVIVLFAIDGSGSFFLHGKPRGNNNFYCWLIAFSIWFTILYTAGFFDGVKS